jgi:phosphoesterase RecJ-like protein
MMNYRQLIDVINKNESFVITSHIIPDGDCVGSLLALASILKKMGKTVRPVLRDPIPEVYKFLTGSEEIRDRFNSNAADVVIVLDCGEWTRTGFDLAEIKTPKIIVNIDHHSENELFADINIVDTSSSSVGEMIYYLFEKHIILDASIAEPLYVSIMTDTGNFRYSNVSARCFRAVANLVESGIKPSHIYRKVYEKRTPESLIVLSRALSTLKLTSNNRCAWMEVTMDMLKESNAKEEETEGIVNYARELDGVEVAALFKESGDGNVRVSLRSNDWVDVSELARLFKGGGHKRAAGCTIESSLDKAVNMVIQKVDSFLCDDRSG